MDPVSLGLGLAPLCLSAIEAAKYIRKRIKIIEDLQRELCRFRKRFKIQTGIFRDECHLLLQDAGTDDWLVEHMLDDFTHSHWTSPELEARMETHLGQRYKDAKVTVDEINSQIIALKKVLQKIENDNSIRAWASLRKLRVPNVTSLSSHKAKFQEGIEALTESVHWFGHLRKMAMAKSDQEPSGLQQKTALPSVYRLRGEHSASFHDVFIRTWSCFDINGSHTQHTASLMLYSDDSTDAVDFRLVLEYEAVSGALRQNSLLLLKVRSEDLPRVTTSILTPEPSTSSSQEPEGRPPKIRRVRYVAGSSASAPAKARAVAASPVKDSTSLQAVANNLGHSTDLCRDIFEHSQLICRSRQEACIGYLDAQRNLRHRLIAAQDRESMALQTCPRSTKKLVSILEPASAYRLSVHDQLLLALQLARSVLQYHATPWWHSRWSLADLTYFEIDEDELSASLGTLHIDTKLSHDTAAADPPLTMASAFCRALPTATAGKGKQREGGGEGDDEVEARLACGIRNMTLFNLGAALLQIGRWEQLDSDDAVQVRRAAGRRASRLGRRYDALTEKCLYCDFGFGDDLTTPQLQAAVYKGVVCELEQMVAIFGGE